MLGAIIGDIAGSAYEMKFQCHPASPFFVEKTRFTDDTILTCATAKTLLTTSFLPYKLRFARQYKEWATRYPDRGYGSRFKEWVKTPKMEVLNSYADGCMMRCSPIAMFYENREVALEKALQSIAYTHNSPESARGVQSIVDAIWMARHGSTMVEIQARVEEHYGHMIDRPLFQLRNTASRDIRCNLIAPQALTCFFKSTDFASAIRNAIFIGGDTDTNASIAGALAEAYYGVDNIPIDMVSKSMDYLYKDAPEMIPLINDFYKACKISTNIINE